MSTEPSSPRRPFRMDLSPLRDSRDLRLLFAGGGISFAGSMLTFVALPYQTYEIRTRRSSWGCSASSSSFPSS